MEFYIRAAREEDAASMVELLDPIIRAGTYTVMDGPLSVDDQVDFIRGFSERGVPGKGCNPMPVRLGVYELILVFACLLVLITLAVLVAVLLLRSRPASENKKDRGGGDIPDVLTPADVAALLRVDVETVENLIRDGELPAVKVGQDWRVSKANVMAFIDAGSNVGDDSRP